MKVRKARIEDLSYLVEFTAEEAREAREAREAEGSVKIPDTLKANYYAPLKIALGIYLV
ncbi:hypothetical protein [uncultured Vibrio sp.]|uniref:hypothetical protein n=1 Tax=uncultured Vibrio sp. TaxID=114054 RepID=UPI0025DFBE77|nr:hypothetical protein [uncultured Vibrio sp.]